MQEALFSQQKASTFSSYEEMKEQALACQGCELCKTRTNVVISDGNPQAKLMLIGEGPGEQEDLTGTPFVGRAGQLLDKIIQAVEIDRQTETYICNVVKCRPPGNRVPTLEEAQGCIHYLEYQIQHVNPDIVLCLGATALKYALGLKNPKITKLHGKWLDHSELPEDKQALFKDKLIMPFYHPSYLLRNASREKGAPKWQAWQAIQLVKETLG